MHSKNPYANIPLAVWLQSAAILISRSGSMVLVFLPLYLIQRLHFSTLAAGQIVSFYGLGEIIGSYYGGKLVDKVGFFHIQTITLLLTGLLYISLEFFHAKLTIMAIMLGVGMSSAAIRPAVGAALAAFCHPDIRGKAFSLNYQAINLGSAIGPAIGGVLAGISYYWLFRIDGTANVIAAIVMFLFFYNRKPVLHEESHAHDLTPSISLHNKKFFWFLFFIFLIGMGFFQVLNMYPIFLKLNYHLSEEQIGLVMSLNCVLIILFQIYISNTFREYPVLKIIAVGGLLVGLSYFILPFYAGFYYAMLSMAIMSFGEMLSMPFAYDYVMKIAPKASRGKYLGLYSLAMVSLPLFLTPIIMPALYTYIGANLMWYGMGVVGVVVYVGLRLI